jgi:four helix bundle protein
VHPGASKGDQISRRLLELSARVIDVIDRLPSTPLGKSVAGQLVRCAPGVGAHYEEARGAESRADFIHKLGVALKELRETVHWLRLIQRSGLITADLTEAIREGGELIAILFASQRTAQRNQQSRRS